MLRKFPIVSSLMAVLTLTMTSPLTAAGQSCCVVGGDANSDGSFNIADVTFGVARIFAGGGAPICPEESDANADHSFNIADVTFGIARIFAGGPAPMCPGPMIPVDSATYIVTFNSVWSASSHPDNFPPNPHFSGLVGATHSSAVTFWQVGEFSSSGIKSMAEFGSKLALISEVGDAQNAGDSEFLLSGGFISPSPGETTCSFNITSAYPLVTLVSMLAPSPDWFIGVSGLELYDGSQWVDTVIVELYPYDAGTDDGATYTSANAVTTPPEVIKQIVTAPFLVGPQVPSLGSFIFIKQ